MSLVHHGQFVPQECLMESEYVLVFLPDLELVLHDVGVTTARLLYFHHVDWSGSSSIRICFDNLVNRSTDE